MTCELFMQLLGGERQFEELTRAERAAMKVHLDDCYDCLKATLARTKRVESALSQPEKTARAARINSCFLRDAYAEDPEITR